MMQFHFAAKTFALPQKMSPFNTCSKSTNIQLPLLILETQSQNYNTINNIPLVTLTLTHTCIR